MRTHNWKLLNFYIFFSPYLSLLLHEPVDVYINHELKKNPLLQLEPYTSEVLGKLTAVRQPRQVRQPRTSRPSSLYISPPSENGQRLATLTNQLQLGHRAHVNMGTFPSLHVPAGAGSRQRIKICYLKHHCLTRSIYTVSVCGFRLFLYI